MRRPGETSSSRGRRILRAITLGSTAAAVTGLVSGVVTRFLMHVVVVVSDGTPHFDAMASGFIAFMYAALLLPGCVALAYRASRASWALFSLGVVVLLFEAVVIGSQSASFKGLSGSRQALLLAVLVVMAVAYAIHVTVAARWSRAAAAPVQMRTVLRHG